MKTKNIITRSCPLFAFFGQILRWTSVFVLAMAILPFAPLLKAQPVESASPGNIEGVVYNSSNGLPVGRAVVRVKGTNQEMLTDDEGRFYLPQVPAGTVLLEVSYLGFETQTASVVVDAGKIATHDFQLIRTGSVRSRVADGDAVVMMEKYNVVADQTMSAQALAMNEQRSASNIKNVVAFEELGDFGMENIGDYVRFLPGVAILDDGENPGKLALGGFPAEMSNIQLDGGSLASTGVGSESGRSLSLQEVPMINIERVEVTKVPTPDMPASGLGGSLNLITKSLLGSKRAYIDYKVYMNLDSKGGLSTGGGDKQPTPQVSPRNKKPSYSINLAVPLNKRLAFSMGASYTWKQRPADDTPNEQAIWNLKSTDAGGAAKDIALANAMWSQIGQIAITENIQAGVEIKLSRNDTLALGIQYRETATETATSRMTFRFHSANAFDPVSTDPANYTESKAGKGVIEMGGNSLQNYDSITKNTHLTLRYKHRGPKWKLDGQLIRSDAKREPVSKDKGYFAGVYASRISLNLSGTGIGSVSDSILPSDYIVETTSGQTIDPYDGNSYNLNTVREETGLYKTINTSGRLDAERIFSRHFSIKGGASFSRMEKDDWRVAYNYTFAGGAAGNAVAGYDFIDESIGVTMNGQPIRWISPVKVYDLYREHPEYFALNSSAIQYRAQNSKRMIEEIGAAYLRFDFLFFNRLRVIAGARYEKTELDGWSMKQDNLAQYQRDENGIPIPNDNGIGYKPAYSNTDERNRLIYKERAHHEGNDYDGFYPSINASYSFTENLILRAAYARTIGRPDVKYVVAGISLPDPAETNSETARTITVGNPGLEPWTADSFHLSLDSYLFKGGFGSVGVYQKEIANFFIQRTATATEEILRAYGIDDTDIDYMLNEGYALRRHENGGDARLTGFEFSYRQDLFFLPSWLQTVQVWLNYTHLKVSGENSEDFIGFTPDAFSAGINFIRPRFSVRLFCSYQAETKRALVGNAAGTSSSNYIPDSTYDYQASRIRYGLTAEYSLSRAFSLYLNWDNIFDDDLTIYRRASNTPSYAQKYQRYASPSYIMVGIKGRF